MQDNSSSGGVALAFVVVAGWFINTGLGLWRLRESMWGYALVTAGIFMIMLNIMLMFHGGEFVRSPGLRIFHLSFLAIGLYTVIILLLPRGRAEFKPDIPQAR
jgi:hypothetical protein